MKIRINDKKISDLKVINILYVVLSVVRKIIVIPIALTHVSINAIILFIPITFLFGLTKGNKFMDNIVLNWIELFSNYR